MTRPQAAPAELGPVVGGREAARRLGVDERTILRWSEDGTLPVAFRTRGGHRRYRETVLAELLEEIRGDAATD